MRWPMRRSHCCGPRISSIEGSIAGDVQHTSTARGPPTASTAAMNRSPAA